MVGEAQTAKGFKMTEVGEIPVDWEIYQLANVVDNISSGSSNTSSENGNYILYGSTGQIGKKSYYDYNGKRILIARVGANAGNLYQVSGNYCVSDNTLMLSIKNAFNIDYLFNYLRNYNLNKLVFGSGQPLITGGQLKVLSIAIPPTLAEQKAIATALSDVDGYITKLEELIVKKKLIKQGAMQELLTGKRRLPGFDGDWEEKRLGDVILKYQNGYSFSAEGYIESGMPIITMAQISLEGKFQFKASKVNYWSTKAAEKLTSFYVHDGDVIISMTDVTPEKNLIGRMCVVKSKIPMLLNQRVGLIKIDKDKVNNVFLCALSNQTDWRKYCIGIASLGVQANIGTFDIQNGIFNLPSDVKEQQAIAQILSDMDLELEALEQKRDKYKNIKQGMMQQLLTGRVRLV